MALNESSELENKFIGEFESLERKFVDAENENEMNGGIHHDGHPTVAVNHLGRKSLYRQFDPLVDNPPHGFLEPKTPARTNGNGVLMEANGNATPANNGDITNASLIKWGTPMPCGDDSIISNTGRNPFATPNGCTPAKYYSVLDTTIPVDITINGHKSETPRQPPQPDFEEVDPSIQSVPETPPNNNILNHNSSTKAASPAKQDIINQQLQAQEILYQEKLAALENELLNERESRKEVALALIALQAANQELAMLSNLAVESVEKERDLFSAKLEDSELERENALRDISGLEASFSELHGRYEKMKAALEASRTNEDHLSRENEEKECIIRDQSSQYEALKAKASEAIEK